MRTFGESARYDDEPWGADYLGRQDVRTFYAQLLRAPPDINIFVGGIWEAGACSSTILSRAAIVLLEVGAITVYLLGISRSPCQRD
jgi:hypothetical protein